MNSLIKALRERQEKGILCKFCQKEYIKFEDKFGKLIPIDKNKKFHDCEEKKEFKRNSLCLE